MELRILPRNIADMIAAGEVVQRPASVVKELMENAVDAGASQVTVVITDAGRTLIQVIDDGCGMSPDEAVLCFERHATSKIASAEDLMDIATFGFRGEALASIAAVADVTLRTRRPGDQVGVEVEFSASEHRGTREVSTPEGANFAVRNLFFNIPARRKFLKSDAVEFRHIVEAFQRVALTRPDIAFTLLHNGHEVHVARKTSSLKFRIQDLLGPALAGELIDVTAESSLAGVSGYAGRPDAARKTLGNQYLFVNGRYFRSPYLHKAVLKAYEHLIPDGTTPPYFLYLDVDPHTIDVNIHPTKTEIKFEEEGLLFQLVMAAVKEAMGREGAGGTFEFNNPDARQMPVIGSHFEEYHPVSIPTAGVDPNFNPFDPMPSPAGDAAGANDGRGNRSWKQYTDASANYGALFEDRAVPIAQVLVVQGRYILSHAASGIMVTSIRRARERILYDRFIKAMGRTEPLSQTALFPVQLTVGVQGRLLLDEHAALLKSLGFDIDPFGNDTVVVNGVPEGFSAEAPAVRTMMDDLLLLLSDAPASLPAVMEQSLAQKFAVLGASGGERVASAPEAQQLLEALLASENPEYTASGKRIISILSTEELAKRF